MIDRIHSTLTRTRYYISAELINLAIWILPDEYTKEWMSIGIQVAAEGIENGLTEES